MYIGNPNVYIQAKVHIFSHMYYVYSFTSCWCACVWTFKTNHTMSRDHFSTLYRHNVPHSERPWMWLWVVCIVPTWSTRYLDATLFAGVYAFVILPIVSYVHSDINCFYVLMNIYIRALSMYLTSYLSKVEDEILGLLRMKCESQKQHSTKLYILNKARNFMRYKLIEIYVT